jgi:hypothetical protein
MARCGGSLALGFVIAGSGSHRAMTRLGSESIPSTYLSAGPPFPPAGRGASRGVVRRVAAREAQRWRAGAISRNAVRFDYPRDDDWRSQFMLRPHPVQGLRVGECRVVVERTRDTDRLLWMAGPPARRAGALERLAERAARRRRKFFAFLSADMDRRLGAARGFTRTAGALVVLVASRERLAAALALPASAAAHGHGRVTSPDSPWFLGPWDIQAGDRM